MKLYAAGPIFKHSTYRKSHLSTMGKEIVGGGFNLDKQCIGQQKSSAEEGYIRMHFHVLLPLEAVKSMATVKLSWHPPWMQSRKVNCGSILAAVRKMRPEFLQFFFFFCFLGWMTCRGNLRNQFHSFMDHMQCSLFAKRGWVNVQHKSTLIS